MKIIEEYKLKNFEKIFSLKDSSYGGSDEWFREYVKSEYLERKGSGLIAAANMLIYTAKSNEKYKMLFTEELNYTSYMDFAVNLQKFIKVTPFRIFTVYQMNKGIRKYTNSRGKKMHLMRNHWKWNSESAFEYIKSGLFSGSPVLMITWNTKISELKNRWVCITELKRYEDGKIEITTSNKGMKKTYNLDDWINSKSLYKGLIYYK